MDEEMTADREAVRALVRRWGATPVMWEEITPRDQQPNAAYLEGVDTSDALVLLLGSRYGVPDSSGYSPTHQEANRARDRHIPRLLFVHSEIADQDRAGKLNDWLRELYVEVSGGRYTSPADLSVMLEERFRETAAAMESVWLKLGPIVFPGSVTSRRGVGGAAYNVNARVRDAVVRRALTDLVGMYTRIRADRLSLGIETQPITVQDVTAGTVRTSESEVVITCSQSHDQRGAYGSLGGVTFADSASGRSYGPADHAEQWAARAVFGASTSDAGRARFDMRETFSMHDGPTLPEVLRTHGAGGWVAEGLTRLFLVEHLTTKFGGHFESLEIGPATAKAVRVSARFLPDSASRAAIVSGAVPLA
jgi:hypothetical protein